MILMKTPGLVLLAFFATYQHVGWTLGCTDGFFNFANISDLARECTTSGACVHPIGGSTIDVTIVIPSMTFTGSSTIVKWRVGGIYVDGKDNNIPRLQIWRPDTSDPMPSRYTIAHEFPLLTSDGGTWMALGNNVYEHQLPGVEHFDVNPGDIVGIYLPSESGNRRYLRVFFENSAFGSPSVDYYSYSGTLTEFIWSGSTSNGRPLVAFDVLCDASQVTAIPTEEAVTMTPTTMTPTTMEPTTMEPTTMEPTTMAPTTMAPITMAPTTIAPPTMEPATMAPTTSTIMEATTMAPPTADSEGDGTGTLHTLISTHSSNTTTDSGDVGSSINDNDSVVIVGVMVAILLAFLLASFGIYAGIGYFRRRRREPERRANLEHTSAGNPAYFGDSYRLEHQQQDMELKENQAYAATPNIPLEPNQCYGITTPSVDPDQLYVTVERNPAYTATPNIPVEPNQCYGATTPLSDIQTSVVYDYI